MVDISWPSLLSIRRDHLFSALRDRLKDNKQPLNQSEAALLPILSLLKAFNRT